MKSIKRDRMLFQNTRTIPVCIVTNWNNISRDILSHLIQYIHNANDVMSMELVCRRWRDIIRKDKDLDKGYWKRLALQSFYKNDPRFIQKDRTPDIAEWYRTARYRTWRDFYRRIVLYPNTWYSEYFSMYIEWLMWRYTNSQSDKRFDQYFDIYVMTSCSNCSKYHKKCPVYTNPLLKLQRLNLDISKCKIVDANVELVFLPPKGTDIFNFGFERDSSGDFHMTHFELKIVNRYNKVVNQHIMDRARLSTKCSILSMRQRKLAGKLLLDNEDGFMQPGKFNSVLGHGNSRNSTYYAKQSNYESRVQKGSIMNMRDISISDIIGLHTTLSIPVLYSDLHNSMLLGRLKNKDIIDALEQGF